MSARRICACGADLEVAGDALFCVGCGARARTWRVLLNGRVVAASALPWAAAADGPTAVIALAQGFEARLLELRDGPPEPRRFAIPSSWRRGHRKRQQVRR